MRIYLIFFKTTIIFLNYLKVLQIIIYVAFNFFLIFFLIILQTNFNINMYLFLGGIMEYEKGSQGTGGCTNFNIQQYLLAFYNELSWRQPK